MKFRPLHYRVVLECAPEPGQIVLIFDDLAFLKRFAAL
jgi:hypothetical protein